MFQIFSKHIARLADPHRLKLHFSRYKLLKYLSIPRFIFRAAGVPFLFKTTAEIGKLAGLKHFDKPLVQICALVVATFLAVTDRLRFTNSLSLLVRESC
jgi:hypothetical protein